MPTNPPRTLTDKQRRFVDEYLGDLNATQAAIRAGYSQKTARQAGAECLSKPVVMEAIRAAIAERSRRTNITVDAVLARFWEIATADPRELIEYRRTCCRHCHGEAFDYQRTRRELATARRLWDATQKKNSTELFDEQGGDGFNATRDPNPDCPECFGEGVERTFVHDTRKLSRSALALYAGVKVTKDGLEVKMHDQHAALVNVGKHLGMFDEKPDAPENEEQRARRLHDALNAMDEASGVKGVAA